MKVLDEGGSELVRRRPTFVVPSVEKVVHEAVEATALRENAIEHLLGFEKKTRGKITRRDHGTNKNTTSLVGEDAKGGVGQVKVDGLLDKLITGEAGDLHVIAPVSANVDLLLLLMMSDASTS